MSDLDQASAESTRPDEVLRALRRIIHAVDLHSRKLAQQVGLTGPQLVVLKEAALSKSISVGQLARHVSLRAATVTGILDRLERQGYVLRTRHAEDKRRVMVAATAKGLQALVRAPSMLQDRFIMEFERLHDWEQHLILSSLQRLAGMMETQEFDAAPLLWSGPVSEGQEDAAEPPTATDRKRERSGGEEPPAGRPRRERDATN